MGHARPRQDRSSGRACFPFWGRSGPDAIQDFAKQFRCSCVLLFPAKLERKWDLISAVDRNFQLYKIADENEEFVQIDFIEADVELELPACFEFYSNVSGNFVFSGVGIEIAKRLGRYFGVKCEPM